MDGNYFLVDSTGNATEVKGEIKIGRGKASDLVLKDKLVSRHHATVWVEDGKLMLRDEESVNGTFVNRKQIYETVELQPQDKVQFGDEMFVVQLLPGEMEDATVELDSVVVPDMAEVPEPAAEPDEMPAAEPEKEAPPPLPSFTPKETDDAFVEAEDEQAGGLGGKKLIIIGVVLLVLICCCIVIGAGGWYYFNNIAG